MPLPPSVRREHLHTRRYEFCGYRREDGLWDIEGHMTDVKTYSFPNDYRGEIKAGEPVHDMWVRLTLDDDFQVVDIEVATEAGPFQICPDIAPAFKVMKGERIQPGWHQRIKTLLGGVKGCIHLAEMLGAMGTVAFQTMHGRPRGKPDPARRPPHLDSCHALASDGELVKRYWPQFYRGN